MLAILYISNSPDEINRTVEEKLIELELTLNHPDVLIIEDEKGVEVSKNVIEFFKLKPFNSDKKVAIIKNAEKLTNDAQNALLKTLEEPPEYGLLILGAATEAGLLPTLLSRCQKIYLNGESQFNYKEWEETVNKLTSSDLEGRFEVIEKTEDKEGLLQALVIYCHKNLNSNNVDFAKAVIQAEEWQKSNVNIRGILEYLALKIH